MNTTLVREWLTLYEEKKNLDEQLITVKAKLAKMDDSIKEEFSQAAVDKISLDGRTIYIACDRWPKAKNGNSELTAWALKEFGYGSVVKETFNALTLRGLTNEMVRTYLADLPDSEKVSFQSNDAIPEALKPYLEISDVYSVKARKA